MRSLWHHNVTGDLTCIACQRWITVKEQKATGRFTDGRQENKNWRVSALKRKPQFFFKVSLREHRRTQRQFKRHKEATKNAIGRYNESCKEVASRSVRQKPIVVNRHTNDALQLIEGFIRMQRLDRARVKVCTTRKAASALLNNSQSSVKVALSRRRREIVASCNTLTTL